MPAPVPSPRRTRRRHTTHEGAVIEAPLTLAEREARLTRRGASLSIASGTGAGGSGWACQVLLLDGRVFIGRGPEVDAARSEALALAEEALGLLDVPGPGPPAVPVLVRLRRAAPWMAVCLVALVGAVAAHRHIPAAPGPGPDLNCEDIGHQVRVEGVDHHRLDADGDGIGCEADGRRLSLLALVALGLAGGAGLGAGRAYLRAGSGEGALPHFRT